MGGKFVSSPLAPLGPFSGKVLAREPPPAAVFVRLIDKAADFTLRNPRTAHIARRLSSERFLSLWSAF